MKLKRNQSTHILTNRLTNQPTSTRQVVGRVHLGRDALEALSDIGTTPDDAPLQRIKIVK